MKFTVTCEMAPVQEMLKKLGLDKDGAAQMELTRSVAARIGRYMPYRTGHLADHKIHVVGPHSIWIDGPYARYLYFGKVMINADTGKGPRKIPGIGLRWPKGAKLKETARPLQYDKTKHPQAGPYWDRRLVAAERDAIVADVQNYINGRKGK